MADLLSHLPRVWQRRTRSYRYNDSVLAYSDRELRARYGFGRASIQYIITNLTEDDLQRKTKRGHALKLIDQVLIALQFYASGNFLQVIGVEVHRFMGVHNVSQLVSTKQNEFVKWPTTKLRAWIRAREGSMASLYYVADRNSCFYTRTDRVTLVFYLNLTKNFDQFQEGLPVKRSSVWTNEAKWTVSSAVRILFCLYLVFCIFCILPFLKSYGDQIKLKTLEIHGN